ncbi:MAG: hypothetical protein MUC81_12685 [Bacteroidia bacterium]|jgi:hypothetical protein|nr:hypothetical protein [Bacteroidia bacterium]
MVNESFETFVAELDGERIAQTISPFIMYRITPKCIIHFIDTEYYVKMNVSSTLIYDLNKFHQHSQIELIHVWSDLWYKFSTVIKNRIQAKLGNAKKLFARNLSIIKLKQPETKLFLDKYHLLGTTAAYYKFGLIQEQQLKACATFSKARTMYDGPVYYKSYELERFLVDPEYSIAGGLSKLLKHFIQQTGAKHIMTYTDNEWGKGNGFLKLGFKPIDTAKYQTMIYDINTGTRKQFKEEVLTASQKLIYTGGSTKYILDLR